MYKQKQNFKRALLTFIIGIILIIGVVVFMLNMIGENGEFTIYHFITEIVLLFNAKWLATKIGNWFIKEEKEE